jgi:hypothetical protein
MPEINFQLKGQRYNLTHDAVENALRGIEPDVVREYAVQIGSKLYPVKQAFSVAVGLDKADFISTEARRHLIRLGFNVFRKT